ncbi:DNA-binding protein, partial [Flavobacteriaceae bacterium]|nr:DNA-binding protein [Flavobacteriaceae bacterium]
MELEIGQKVTIIIGKETPLGFVVLIEESKEGLVYKSEVFSDLEQGITTIGYVKNIREDEKIDISLRPLGYKNTIEDDKAKILYQLVQKNGEILLTDK